MDLNQHVCSNSFRNTSPGTLHGLSLGGNFVKAEATYTLPLATHAGRCGLRLQNQSRAGGAGDQTPSCSEKPSELTTVPLRPLANNTLDVPCCNHAVDSEGGCQSKLNLCLSCMRSKQLRPLPTSSPSKITLSADLEQNRTTLPSVHSKEALRYTLRSTFLIL